MRVRELIQPLRLRYDNHILFIPDAPLRTNIYMSGIRELFRRIQLTKDMELPWSRFRELAKQYGVFVDPRDDVNPDDDRSDLGRRYAGIAAQGLVQT